MLRKQLQATFYTLYSYSFNPPTTLGGRCHQKLHFIEEKLTQREPDGNWQTESGSADPESKCLITRSQCTGQSSIEGKDCPCVLEVRQNLVKPESFLSPRLSTAQIWQTCCPWSRTNVVTYNLSLPIYIRFSSSVSSSENENLHFPWGNHSPHSQPIWFW